MATTLYFHLASSALSLLPGSERSALGVSTQVDANGINRTMDGNIGTGFTTGLATSLGQTAQQNIYFHRFVSSAGLSATTINATTWIFKFAARESAGQANYPVTGTASTFTYIHLYVWNTNNSTYTASILDGNTASYFIEAPTTGQGGENGQFAGTSVTGLTASHVLICEIWARPAQANTGARQNRFFYDGTSAIFTTGVSNPDPASFIETGQNLFTQTFSVAITETTAISETATRILTGLRSATETTSISETLSRVPTFIRSIATETTAISETLTRLYRGFRTITETTAISETLTRLASFFRTLVVETITTSETLTGSKVVGRSITETVVVSETLTRLYQSFRTITETNTISETLTRIKTGIRSLVVETITISETLSRLYRAFRTITETTAITETLTGVNQSVSTGFQHCLAALRHIGRR